MVESSQSVVCYCLHVTHHKSKADPAFPSVLDSPYSKPTQHHTAILYKYIGIIKEQNFVLTDILTY